MIETRVRRGFLKVKYVIDVLLWLHIIQREVSNRPTYEFINLNSNRVLL